MTLPLQSCAGALDCWSKGSFFEAIVQGVQANASIAVVALLLVVPLYLGLFWWAQSHTVPMTAMVLMGAAVFPLMPAVVARLMWIGLLLTGGVALFAVVWAVIR